MSKPASAQKTGLSSHNPPVRSSGPVFSPTVNRTDTHEHKKQLVKFYHEHLPESPIDICTEKGKKLLENLQGNILKSHGRNHSKLLFITFKAGKEKAARSWIAEFSKNYVKSALEQKEHSRKIKQCTPAERPNNEVLFASVMLSANGYRKLHLSNFIPGDHNFQHGMQNQTDVDVGLLPILGLIGDIADEALDKLRHENPLGDPPVKQWEEGFQRPIDAMIILAAGDDYGGKCQGEANLKKFADALVNSNEFKLVVAHSHFEDGNVIREEKGNRPLEHFGHPDGISQPLFLKQDVEDYKIKNHISKDHDFAKYFNPITDLDEVLVVDELGHHLDSEAHSYHLGSYFVYRKLHQDVKRYNELVENLSKTLNVSKDEADAQVIGRYKDGKPLIKSKKETIGPNNFDFGKDKSGEVCPFQAHIRKTNPRVSHKDPIGIIRQRAVPFQKNRRIARRGVTYGPKYDVTTAQNDRGLHFICANANIAEQFVFMQVIWCNNPGFQKRHTGIDPIVGQFDHDSSKANQHWIDKDKHKKEFLFNKVVTMKGGEYFFAPAINTLKNLDKFKEF